MLVTESKYRRFIDNAKTHAQWSIDTETTGLGLDDRLVGIGIKPMGGESGYLPFRHMQGSNLPESCLHEVLELCAERELFGWNAAKFDATMLKRDGAEWMQIHDLMYGAFLVDENQGRGSYNIRHQIKKWEGSTEKQDRMDEILEENLLTKGDICRLDAKQVEEYACDDVDQVEWLLGRYMTHLNRQGLVDVWHGMSEYGQLVGLMCERGVPINVGGMIEEKNTLQHRMMSLIVKARKIAGRPVTMTPKSIGRWLDVADTSQETLESVFGADDPKVRMVREFRIAQRGISSYYAPCIRHHQNGRIHPDIVLIGTATGRLANWSGKGKVNLLAMPRNTEEYRFKHFIEAPEGQLLLNADYQRAEMCLATHYAQEHAMAEILTSGVNVHQATADRLKIEYDPAKRAKSLSKALNCSVHEAQRYLNAYNTMFPGFVRFYNRAQTRGTRRRYIQMWTGRRRHYTGRAFWDCHKASDHIVQGGIGELIRIKQTALHHELPDVHQILQVYDSALMLIPDDGQPQKWADAVQEIMRHDDFLVPMQVDIGIGKTLGNTKEYSTHAA
jgi:DNA polymerase I-like protein with 3'-5' exonuclease and polymerase domains